MSPKKRLILTGDDIVSHMMVAKLIESNQDTNYAIHCDLSNERSSAPERLRAYYRAERSILRRRLESNPAQIPHLVDREVSVGQRIDSDDFHAWVRHVSPDSALSVRCYQKLTANDIRLLDLDHPVVNLHPGLLPKYRGVLTFAHALINNERTVGWTLHDMNTEWDAGDLRSVVKYGAVPQASVIENMALGVEPAAHAVTEYWRHGGPATPQVGCDAGYVTHLGAAEVGALDNKGIKLWNANWVRDAYLQLGIALDHDDNRAIGVV